MTDDEKPVAISKSQKRRLTAMGADFADLTREALLDRLKAADERIAELEARITDLRAGIIEARESAPLLTDRELSRVLAADDLAARQEKS